MPASPSPAPSEWRQLVEQLQADAAGQGALPGPGEGIEDFLARRRDLAQRFVSALWVALGDPLYISECCERSLQLGKPQLASPGKGGVLARVDGVLEALAELSLADIAKAEAEEGGVVIFEREPQLESAPAPAAEPWEEPAPAAVELLPEPEPTPSDLLVAELIPAEPAPPEPAPLPPGDWRPIAAAAAELGADAASLEALVARGALIAHVDGALIVVELEAALEALTAPDLVEDEPGDDDPGEALDQLLDELRERELPGRGIAMVCGRCGKEFFAKTKRGKWCSAACRSAASKQHLIETRGYGRKPKG